MRVVKVLAHIEIRCAKCGEHANVMGLASVTPDGRIGEPVETCDMRDTCNACDKTERDAERVEHEKSLAQRRWARGRVGGKRP